MVGPFVTGHDLEMDIQCHCIGLLFKQVTGLHNHSHLASQRVGDVLAWASDC